MEASNRAIADDIRKQIAKSVAPKRAAERLLGIRTYREYRGDDDQWTKDVQLVATEYLRIIKTYGGDE